MKKQNILNQLLYFTFSLIFLNSQISAQENLRLVGRWAYGNQEQLIFNPGDKSIGYLSSGANLVVMDFTDPLNPIEVNIVTVDKILNDFILIEDYLYLGTLRQLLIYKISNKTKLDLINKIDLPKRVDKFFYHENTIFQIGNGYISWIDITDKESPQVEQVIQIGENMPDLAFKNDYIYGCISNNADSTLYVIDNSNPDSALVTSMTLSEDFINTVEIVGSLLYVGGRDSLHILDTQNPAQPGVLKTVHTGWLYDIRIIEDLALFSAQGNRISIFNISDILNPALIKMINGSSAITVRFKLPYVYALTGGVIQIHDISDPSNPIGNVASLSPGGFFGDVSVYQSRIFIPAYDDIVILDISDPSNPHKISTIAEGSSGRMEILDHNAYILKRWGGWSIVNLADVNNPVILVSLPAADRVSDISIQNNNVYLADWSGGLRIFNIEDPANPTQIGSLVTSGDIEHLIVSGSYVYAHQRNYGLKVIDVSDKSNPVQVDSLPYAGSIQDMIVYENYLYLGVVGGRILDLTDPAHPIDQEIEFDWWTNTTFELSGDTLFVTDLNNGLKIYSLSNPLSPDLIGKCELPYRSVAVCYDGKYIYLLDQDAGIYILEFQSTTTALESKPNQSDLLSVYPNPANDEISMIIEGPSATDGLIILRNSAGVCVYSKELYKIQNLHTIPLRNLSAGIYFLTLKTKNNAETKKIIVLE